MVSVLPAMPQLMVRSAMDRPLDRATPAYNAVNTQVACTQVQTLRVGNYNHAHGTAQRLYNGIGFVAQMA